ncbi:MAG: protein kinase [Burkholderiales bacterium]|nr:protein kinase [Burkholderiales bacterium]
MTPQRIGKYQVERELGRGGMATVYAAVDPVIRRPVAIKVVRRAELESPQATRTLNRFKREAQAAGALNHPNIVSIYEYGEDDEYAWIVMERVDGGSLRDQLIGGWRPEPDSLPAVLSQLLEALEYSHANGVVHRDIKPANVLVSSTGAAKISDFGIARIDRSSFTQVGDVLGTPYYMAPEQFNGEPATERTDIYAAAVVIYEVLAGRRPFTGLGMHLMRQILEEEAPPIASIDPRLPAALEAVLAKALAKRPQDRYQSAGEFLADLKRAYESGAAADAAPRQAAVPGSRLAGNIGALRRAVRAKSAAAPEAGAAAAAAGPGAASGKSTAAPAPRVRRPAVLCVDDEERVLNALALVLRETFEVETLASGALALERIRARRFHVIISDQRMPGMTGVEFLREAKTVAPSTVRILLTGYSDLSAIVGSVNEGEVFRFLNKPWQTEDLRATVNEAADVAIAIEAATAGARPVARTDASVLVFGDPAVGRAAREMARGGHRVMDAPHLDDTLRLLSADEGGVLVFDLDSQGGDDPAALLKVLKKQSPSTQLLVISEASDAELIISLINEARIHKFLKKPVNYSLLHQSVNEAMDRYARMRQSPELARTQAARAGRETAAARAILSKLKALGGRFAAAFRGESRGGR